MRFGMVGLGRIGSSLALQAREKGHEPVGYDLHPEAARRLEDEGVEVAASIEDLAARLPAPRVVLVYVPHGKATDAALRDLADALDEGDVVMDGGNSHWDDSKRHHRELRDAGIRFVDCGTSGGVSGARHGACFMAGGEPDAVQVIEPLLRDLAVPGGFIHAGPAGAGHFVKIIHNAIEFGMVEAIAEGVDLLERGDYDLDLPELFRTWNHGSVIRSWLVELMEQELRRTPDLERLSAFVEDTKEGKWYVKYAVEREAFAPVLALAEMMFYRYRDPDSTTAKAVALLRHGFGEHPVHYRGAPGEEPSVEKAETATREAGSP